MPNEHHEGRGATMWPGDMTELRSNFEYTVRLIELMTSDGEDNFIRGLKHTSELFNRALLEPEQRARLVQQAVDSYLSMWGGMGSLGDYYLTGGPSKTFRRRAEYDSLTKKLTHFVQSAAKLMT